MSGFFINSLHPFAQLYDRYYWRLSGEFPAEETKKYMLQACPTQNKGNPSD
jgi:hypothetical protein